MQIAPLLNIGRGVTALIGGALALIICPIVRRARRTDG